MPISMNFLPLFMLLDRHEMKSTGQPRTVRTPENVAVVGALAQQPQCRWMFNAPRYWAENNPRELHDRPLHCLGRHVARGWPGGPSPPPPN